MWSFNIHVQLWKRLMILFSLMFCFLRMPLRMWFISESPLSTAGLPLSETSCCKKPEAFSESKHKLPNLNQHQPLQPCPPLPPPALPFIHILKASRSNRASTIIDMSTFCCFSCPSEPLRQGASWICILTLCFKKEQLCETSKNVLQFFLIALTCLKKLGSTRFSSSLSQQSTRHLLQMC